LADTIRPGCKGYDFSPTLSSRDVSLDHPHGGSLHLALDTGGFVQATSSGLIRGRPFPAVAGAVPVLFPPLRRAYTGVTLDP
jgi:hypothetical protein